MIKRYQLLLLVALLTLIGSTAFAQQQVTIKELNAYENLTAITELSSHPLVDVNVTFTAVIMSYPKSSGNASFNEGTGAIGRIHVFVKDTSAVSMGWQGMSMQIVESTTAWVENLTRGDIVEFTGNLTFFGDTGQFNVSEEPTVLGNANEESFSRFQPLLDPIVVDLADIISLDNELYSLVLSSYSDYANTYVQVENGLINVVSLGDRPNYQINSGGLRIASNDISLRYRNDRDLYKEGYNSRRSEEQGGKGDFAPIQGAQANVSGFLIMNNFDPIGSTLGTNYPFKLTPFEDGTVWLNNTRFDNGQDVGGTTFAWPNDLVYTGFPALVSNETLSPESPKTTDVVTLNFEVASQEDGVTVDSVKVTYTDASQGDDVVEVTVSATNVGGDNYSIEIPAQPNFTSVTYFFLSYTSNSLIGRTPGSGTNSFLVSDGPVPTIATIQTTGDGSVGNSPLAGLGELPMTITATVVSDFNSGIVMIHEASTPWSGVFLELNAQTENLLVGDEVAITRGSVNEDRGDFGTDLITYITVPSGGITVNSSGNDITSLIPSLTTDEFNAVVDAGEKYEGMLVSLSNVRVTDVGGFGEFEITTTGNTNAVTVNEDTDASTAGETTFPGWVNETMRQDVDITSFTGLVLIHRNATKIYPRMASDIVTADGNFTYPRTNFGFLSPEDNASVEVVGDITVIWNETTDFDGNDVTYEWLLTTPADTNFATPLATVASDGSGSQAQVTLPFSAVDGILAGANVAVGGSVDLKWTVRVSDALDGRFSSTANFNVLTSVREFNITLTRGTSTSIDEVLPVQFALEQNYPNPFNPSTKIDFSLPESGLVNLSIYNMLGQKVSTLVNQRMEAGSHSVNFDAANLSTGMYLYRITNGNTQITRKMMLLK